MKKSLPIIAMVALTISFTSCKKDYTCTCTTSAVGLSGVTSTTTINDTKSNAKASCDTGDITTSFGTTDCELN